MSDTKFTPGPWMAHETGRARSEVPEHEIHWTDDGECVAEVVHGIANAQLIAAAPELYKVLDQMTAFMHEPGCYSNQHPMVQAGMQALAKARGEKS